MNGRGTEENKNGKGKGDIFMLKKIGLIVLCVAIGFGLGIFLTMVYEGHKIASGMFILQ